MSAVYVAVPVSVHSWLLTREHPGRLYRPAWYAPRFIFARTPCSLVCSASLGDTCLGIEVVFTLTDEEFRTWNPEV